MVFAIHFVFGGRRSKKTSDRRVASFLWMRMQMEMAGWDGSAWDESVVSEVDSE